jgi:hypothetical protein
MHLNYRTQMYRTQIRVVLGGMASGAVRSLIETPLEYAKVCNLLIILLNMNFILIEDKTSNAS